MIGHAVEGDAHEVDPCRDRRATTLLALTELARVVVETDANDSDDIGIEPCEPGVSRSGRRARLAGKIVAPGKRSAGTGAGAELNHVLHDVRNQIDSLRRLDVLRTP